MGIVDSRTIEKFKKEAKDKGRDSWWLAYVMDSSDEEKAKGKTVEMGRACIDTPTKSYTIFDAPGHKNYVPNMIMGATLADFGGLVISARRGEFEAGFEQDGQTREHIQLARSLGISKLVVVVNKMDEATVSWKKQRWDDIRSSLTPFLNGCGYTENDLFWVPISGLTGQNIVEPVSSSICNWYTGPTLLEILDKMPIEPRNAEAPLRIPVLDRMKDSNRSVIFGKIE
jgi:peptide chain release factor subunit 3